MLRTHTCGELMLTDNKKAAILCGWVLSRRDHGGLIFIDLRDRYGITQVVFDPKHNKDSHQKAEHISREDVIQIKGKVRPRGKGLENPKLKTGEIEVIVDELNMLNKSKTPPLEIDDNKNVSDDMRLKYRYLDLRRPHMQANLLLRHKIIKKVRDYFDKLNFIEVETPILAKSTPEGARDYLVPSRLHSGKFYALPQSPQLFKQLLMLAGFDRYLQIAKCFRDEDLRADRQPEFTQIDIEMSFIDEEDIYKIGEEMIKEVFTLLGVKVKTPFKRMPYVEAMDKYGIDKPDLRFGIELINVTNEVKDAEFSVFKDTVASGGRVKCINATGCASWSRNDIDSLIEFVKQHGAKGLAWMKMEDKLTSSITKFFNDKQLQKIAQKTNAKKGDILLFIADHKHHIVDVALGHLRLHIAKKLNLINEKEYNFLWVVDFPLVEYDEDQGRHVSVHHPFTSPKYDDLKYLETDPKRVRSKAYDLVLNGTEIGGGSIRIHDRKIQERVFTLLGLSKEESLDKFGFLLNAFEYGAPPHGGMAFGVDRLAALMSGNESIREVIAFPKNKAAVSLMEEAPSDVSKGQLKELHIKVDFV